MGSRSCELWLFMGSLPMYSHDYYSVFHNDNSDTQRSGEKGGKGGVSYHRALQMSTRTRGFGNPKLTPEARKALARKGGKQVQRDGTGHNWSRDKEGAVEAAKKARRLDKRSRKENV